MKIKVIVITWAEEGSEPVFKAYQSRKAANAEYPNQSQVFDAQIWESGKGVVKKKPYPAPPELEPEPEPEKAPAKPKAKPK